MLQNILLVGVGGFFGSISRYGVGQLFSKFVNSGFPAGTFAVNIIGSFIIGIVLGAFEQNNISDSWKLLIAVGFCGGFTTFSSFAYENFSLLDTKQFLVSTLYISLSIVVGLFAVFLGFKIVN